MNVENLFTCLSKLYIRFLADATRKFICEFAIFNCFLLNLGKNVVLRNWSYQVVNNKIWKLAFPLDQQTSRLQNSTSQLFRPSSILISSCIISDKNSQTAIVGEQNSVFHLFEKFLKLWKSCGQWVSAGTCAVPPIKNLITENCLHFYSTTYSRANICMSFVISLMVLMVVIVIKPLLCLTLKKALLPC